MVLPPSAVPTEDSHAFDKYTLEYIHNLFVEVVKKKEDVQEEAAKDDDDDDDVADELKKDFVDEQTGEKPSASALAQRKSPKKPADSMPSAFLFPSPFFNRPISSS